MQGTPRIGNVTAGMMIICALVIDGIQALLTFTVLLEPFSFFFTFLGAIIFGLWFMILGIKYFGNDGGKKFLIAIGSTVAELVPFINALPVTTVGVIGIIAQSRVEDARASAGGKVTARTAQASARMARMRASQAARANAAREQRDETQDARHSQ